MSRAGSIEDDEDIYIQDEEGNFVAVSEQGTSNDGPSQGICFADSKRDSVHIEHPTYFISMGYSNGNRIEHHIFYALNYEAFDLMMEAVRVGNVKEEAEEDKCFMQFCTKRDDGSSWIIVSSGNVTRDVIDQAYIVMKTRSHLYESMEDHEKHGTALGRQYRSLDACGHASIFMPRPPGF